MKQALSSRRLLALAGAAVLAIAIAFLAAGQRPAWAGGGDDPLCGGMAMGMGMEHGHGDHFAHLVTALGLTADQQAAARKVHQEISARAEPIAVQARQQHDEIHALLDAGNPDPAQIGQKVIAMYASHKQLEALHQQGMARLTAILSADQRARFEKLKAQHMHGGHGAAMQGDDDGDGE